MKWRAFAHQYSAFCCISCIDHVLKKIRSENSPQTNKERLQNQSSQLHKESLPVMFILYKANIPDSLVLFQACEAF